MHISIIDDEKILGEKMQKKLELEGFAVSIFTSYSDFMQHGDAHSELYLIDISLGDGSGFDIIRWLRTSSVSPAPIMIISGYGDSEKIIYGLDIGADDYMIKPVIPDELVARVKALLRRPKSVGSDTIITHKDITYNPSKRETKIRENKIYLTHKETQIIELFMKNQWKLISRDELISAVWGSISLADVSDNTINVTLSKLRKKMGPHLDIETKYSEGFLLDHSD